MPFVPDQAAPDSAPAPDSGGRFVPDQGGDASANGSRLGSLASSVVRPLAKAAVSNFTSFNEATPSHIAGEMGLTEAGGQKPRDPEQMFEDFLDRHTTAPTSTLGKIGEEVATIGSGALVPGVGGAKMAKPAAETVKQGTYRLARTLGIRVAPHEQEGGSVLAKGLQSLGEAGRGPKVSDDISRYNSERFDELAKADVGLTTQPLTDQSLDQVRATANQAFKNLAGIGTIQHDQTFYTDVADIGKEIEDLNAQFPGSVSPAIQNERYRIQGSLMNKEMDVDQALKYIADLRFQARTRMKSVSQGDPSAKRVAEMELQAAYVLENQIGRHVAAQGNPQMLQEYQHARRLIAKTHAIEMALNTNTGHIDPHKLAQMRMSKQIPLDGRLKQIADIAEAFPDSARSVDKTGAQFDFYDIGMGLFGFMFGHPWWVAAGLSRPTAGKLASSGLFQPGSLAGAPAATGAMKGAAGGAALAASEQEEEHAGDE